MSFNELNDAEKSYFLLALGEVLLMNTFYTRHFYGALKTKASNFKDDGTRVTITINGLSLSDNFAKAVLTEAGADVGVEFVGRVIWGRELIRYGSDVGSFASRAQSHNLALKFEKEK